MGRVQARSAPPRARMWAWSLHVESKSTHGFWLKHTLRGHTATEPFPGRTRAVEPWSALDLAPKLAEGEARRSEERREGARSISTSTSADVGLEPARREQEHARFLA